MKELERCNPGGNLVPVEEDLLPKKIRRVGLKKERAAFDIPSGKERERLRR